MASKKTDVNPEIAEARGDFDEEVKSEEMADVMLDANDRAGIEDGESNPSDETKSESDENNPSDSAEPSQAPLDKEAAKKAKKEEKFVELFIPWREGESEYFECSINLKNFKIKKNTAVKVPKYVRDFYYSYMKNTEMVNDSQNKLTHKD